MARSNYIIVLFLIVSLYCHEGNTANVFDIRVEYNTVKRYVAIILFSLLLLYGIVSNILLIIVFCTRDIPYSRAFICISSQLIICTFLNFIPQVTIVLFGIIATKNTKAHETTPIHSILIVMNTFYFFSMLHFTFFLAVNRLVTMNLPKFNAFFESSKFYFLIVCMWLSALVMSFTEFHYCFKTFNVSNIQWSLNCTKSTREKHQHCDILQSKINFRNSSIFLSSKQLSSSADIFTRCYSVRYFFFLSFPIAMFVVYIPIFLKMRHKRISVIELNRTSGNETMNVAKYERLMLIQAAIICGAIEIQILCYNFLLKLALKFIGKEAAIPVNIFINCYVIFNGSILPTVTLIFVKQFRQNVKRAILNLLNKLKMTKIMFNTSEMERGTNSAQFHIAFHTASIVIVGGNYP
uniref:G-protein coupled receptors family 1 profile domain-containing protein n=1 Tax=Onchocerca volvulus TaxID=6282 RepID=A0A8R1U079_ONCVO